MGSAKGEMTMHSPRIICLTPIKNEEWILEKFLQCASVWADHIILADQQSTDSSREIASRFPKVILLNNTMQTLNEGYHHGLLVDAARQLPSPRLLIAIDADEFLTPNFQTSGEWQAMLRAEPGTVISFWWANIKPNLKQYWSPPERKPFGFMDDGSPFQGGTLHSGRVPIPPDAPNFFLEEVQVMHYQYTDWNRMESKHRWYQCMERVMYPEKSPVNLYRQYHHMDAVNSGELQNVPEWWYGGYSKHGIDIRKIVKEKQYWWDREVLLLLQKHGTKKFAQDSIWDVDWKHIAERLSMAGAVETGDPRTFFEKLCHKYLSLTQPCAQTSIVKNADKVFRRLLR